MIVITAADVSCAGARAIASELNYLQIGDLFDVEEPSHADVFERLRLMGDDATMPEDDLRLKLLTLLTLRVPGRFAADLARISRKSVAFVVKDDALHSIEYRLIKAGQPGAKQVIKRVVDEQHLSIVDCWQEYHRRVDSSREDENWRYFVTFDPTGSVDDALVGAHIETCVTQFLSQFAYTPQQLQRAVRNVARVHTFNGMAFARYGNVFCSKYNKVSCWTAFDRDAEVVFVAA
jgi:hypothetical protein